MVFEQAVLNYLGTRKDNNGALFVGERKPHGRLMKSAIEKRVRQLGEIAGLKRRIYPHLIRHTTATDALDRGMPVEEIQQMLGHVSIATTMIYADVSEKNTKMNHRKCII